MKKLPWLISIVLLVLLVVSSFYFVNKQQIQEQERDMQVNFERKVECAKFISQIKSDHEGSEFVEIFYSSKADSCLYITQRYDKQMNLSTRNFQDALTKETIKFDTFSYDCGDAFLGCPKEKLNQEQIIRNERQDEKKDEFDELIDSYR